jgi:threonine/homoserine/homoserine lactone efflux protein
MALSLFLSAVLALLLAPGPTNTLMALAGAGSGLRRVLRLIPAEIGGYLLAVLPLAWLGAGLVAQVPALAPGLKLVAALWVLSLALRLWRRPVAGDAMPVTARRVFVTTLLNPKALVFGLVLLPGPADSASAPRLALFLGCVIAVALVWGGAGRALGRIGMASGALRDPVFLAQRVAALWLGCLSALLVAGVVGS